MRDEQMLKIFGTVVVALMLMVNVAMAQEDCDCGHNPYAKYELNIEAEMDENPWKVTSVERFDFDLTQEGEPEVCVVQLELITPTESFLYQDFQDIPEDDLELYWNGSWILASEFENQMDVSGCSMEGAQS
jgi:hypothetical protein